MPVKLTMGKGAWIPAAAGNDSLRPGNQEFPARVENTHGSLRRPPGIWYARLRSISWLSWANNFRPEQPNAGKTTWLRQVRYPS